jgi:hypothetical protein
MPLLNPFDTNAFNLVSLTAAINILPNNYGRLNDMNLFPVRSVSTRQVLVEEKNGVLNLLKTLPPGSPGQKAGRDTRRVVSFIVPHIPYDDEILPQEYDGIRAFGTENGVDTISTIMNDHLQSMRNKHAITLEWLRLGALKGIIYDGDGSTILYNLYKEFLIKPKSVDFVFGTSTTDIKAKCLEVRRHIEDNLKGEIMQGDPRVLVDKYFFDALTGHAAVTDAYDRWNNGEALRADMRKGFPFGGLVFEEYNATVSDINGTPRTFFASKYGIAFPIGTMDTFRTIVAPADFTETVNTMGQLIYAKQKNRDFDRGIDIHTQSNPLPICLRPGVLVEVMSST